MNRGKSKTGILKPQRIESQGTLSPPSRTVEQLAYVVPIEKAEDARDSQRTKSYKAGPEVKSDYHGFESRRSGPVMLLKFDPTGKNTRREAETATKR
jgi:hypothetical protein